jgi:hypothetical protein
VTIYSGSVSECETARATNDEPDDLVAMHRDWLGTALPDHLNTAARNAAVRRHPDAHSIAILSQFCRNFCQKVFSRHFRETYLNIDLIAT